MNDKMSQLYLCFPKSETLSHLLSWNHYLEILKAVIADLSKRLIAEFGNGFTATNLRYMRQFYSFFPNYHTLCDKLSWSHCRTIIKVQDKTAQIPFLKNN